MPEHNYEHGREHGGYSHVGIPPGCPACAAESRKADEPDPPSPAFSALDEIKERYAERIKTAPGFGAPPEDFARLVAAIEVADAALKRHMQWFESAGMKICGGCLRPSPCPDADVIAAAVAGKDSSDEQ